MKTYTILKKPDSLDWVQIPKLSMEYMEWTPLGDVTATAQICYDNHHLYIRFVTTETDIRAEHTDVLGNPCEDSCLEFFFSPILGDTRYFNVEINPNCCMYLGIGSSRYDLVRLILNEHDLFHTKVYMTCDGWELTYQIPFSFVRRFFPDFAPSSGKTMRANFYKCKEISPNQHYLVWNRITETDDFHRPCDFGTLIFE